MCAVEGEAASQRMVKLHRGIRVYASVYLQENLLALPHLPTAEQLRQIRQEREKEAKERIAELERERERRRQLEAVMREQERRPREVRRGEVEEEEEEEDGLQSLLDGGVSKLEESVSRIGDSVNKLGDSVSGGLGKIFRRQGKGARVGFSKGGGAEAVSMPLARSGSGSAWIGESLAEHSVDSQEDPFVLQREQLLSYIQQARVAGRLDEVHALEASLREIEFVMGQQQRSYGVSPDQR